MLVLTCLARERSELEVSGNEFRNSYYVEALSAVQKSAVGAFGR